MINVILLSTIEQLIADGFTSIIGDNAILGIIILAFFGAFVMLQNTRLDVKVLVLTPVSVLVLMLIPWWGIILALFLGGIFYLAFTKFINR